MRPDRLMPALLAACISSGAAFAQVQAQPVTDAILANPSAGDWLMMNRTLDQQRFSPLDQINRGNVSRLTLAWSRGLSRGVQESTPLVYQGVMYAYDPGAGIVALDARNGDTIWQYRRTYSREIAEIVGRPETARPKSIAIWQDMVFFTAPDGYIVALDMKTGKERWAAQAFAPADRAEHTGGLMVADGKIISNRACKTRSGCFISAHDAKTGEELWRFNTAAAQGEPGGDTWGQMPDEKRIASSWGMPGSYDPATKTVFWAVANQQPYTRLKRHGSADAISRMAPAELYSNSTIALDVDSGKLRWYYQHLPGDDWDADHVHERTLVRAPFNPDPKFAKWFNPDVKRGEMRDMVISVGEGGGIFALDKHNGQFLWASPFPFDVAEFNISRIDPRTGQTEINWNNVMKKVGDKVITCFHNTRSYWSTAYHPGRTSLYVPFHDSCLEMEAGDKNPQGFNHRVGVLRPGADINKYAGLAKIDISTGKMEVLHTQPMPGNGSALVTAGDVLFWGDMDRRFRAFDAETGKILWETITGGIVMTSTITYAVEGRQYVAIFTGDGQSGTAGPLRIAKTLKPVRGHSAIYVFALPKE